MASAPRLLTDAMVPNAIWHVGRVEATVRKLAIPCIATLLQSNVVSKDALVRVLPALQPPLVSGLDEDYEETTRYLSCIALASLFRKIAPYHDGAFAFAFAFAFASLRARARACAAVARAPLAPWRAIRPHTLLPCAVPSLPPSLPPFLPW